MKRISWKSTLLCLSLVSSLTLPAFAAEKTTEYTLSPNEKTTQLALDRRAGETLEDLKKDPARALALSLLFPGLGQFYVGNDNARSTWVMVGGTAIIVGSLIGWELLKERNQGTVANDLQQEDQTRGLGMGDLLIAGVLVGYHLWNVRDAFMQADLYNYQLEKDSLISSLENFHLTLKQDQWAIQYTFPL